MIRLLYPPALLLSMLLLAGCSGARWDYINPAQPDLLQTQRAKADCQMYIDASRQDNSLTPVRRTAQEWEQEFIDCMAAKGWRYQKVR